MALLLWLGMTSLANTMILCGHSTLTSVIGIAINLAILVHMLMMIRRTWRLRRSQPT